MQKNNRKKLSVLLFAFAMSMTNVGCSSGTNCTIAGRGAGGDCFASWPAPVTQDQPSSPAILPAPVPATSPPSGDFQVCSKLDFTNVSFPSGFTYADTQAFEAALNISGSYEGETAWVNLTNNFDGQGLSLGLLNQCLGQGSLQPLLVDMVNQHPVELGQVFEPAKLQSLVGMLTAWQKAQTNVVMNFEEKIRSQFDLGPVTGTLRPETTEGATSASVQWALAHLYTDNGITFNPAWAAQLTAMAQLPDYISIQLQEAANLHTTSVNYLTRLGIHQLRTYLLMFDFNVQNGGIYSQDWADLATYVSQNPNSNNTDRLREILALRLRHVKPRYVADVHSRKETIIDGTGTVHGQLRNLPAEYCYPQNAIYR